MSSIGLGSCLLRTILDVQFHFGSNIPFQLEKKTPPISGDSWIEGRGEGQQRLSLYHTLERGI